MGLVRPTLHAPNRPFIADFTFRRRFQRPVSHATLSLSRPFQRVQDYVVFRPGTDNAVADLLSRSDAELSHETPQDIATLTDIICTVFGIAALDGLNLKDIANVTAADDELSIVVKCSINGWIPADRRNQLDGICNRLADELSVADGVLF